MLYPKEQPRGCDRELCPLYFDCMNLIEDIARETRLHQDEVIDRLGDPNHPILYLLWQLAIRLHLGERARLCRFEQEALPPGEPEQPQLP